ncbi:uncharacterized protein K452DRAFT_223721 [Aplosporella prunicola CBS 121167]|uniref:Ribosomal RNA-processing protein 40 n=1 Tax=Aplosporella prunicola CBS 121167 TaxID=1176127 RepID=A0A6A6BL99_9PEZI|nr:uncharacterized protein K452DRAFT_223721 [Aplosporella prunicola CBS 121167]KAF2144163.1 hypothetical protein K452DRAFT_223721 [Aplosporella prunicola CBS 121167]
MAAQVLLPGDDVPAELLPVSHNPNKPLTLGPGLRHIPPATITTTTPGALQTDRRKNAVWIDTNGGRYIPAVNDLVVVAVHHSAPDYYHCAITPYTPLATLPHLAFEGATKKTRPILAPGALVYARIAHASRHLDPELECVAASTGRADGLGPLKGGTVFDVSAGMARRLLMPAGKKPAKGTEKEKYAQGEEGGAARLVVLEALSEKLRFEVAVGRNGRVWVDCVDGVRATLAVGQALQRTDREALGVEEQRALVAKLLKAL